MRTTRRSVLFRSPRTTASSLRSQRALGARGCVITARINLGLSTTISRTVCVPISQADALAIPSRGRRIPVAQFNDDIRILFELQGFFQFKQKVGILLLLGRMWMAHEDSNQKLVKAGLGSDPPNFANECVSLLARGFKTLLLGGAEEHSRSQLATQRLGGQGRPWPTFEMSARVKSANPTFGLFGWWRRKAKFFWFWFLGFLLFCWSFRNFALFF